MEPVKDSTEQYVVSSVKELFGLFGYFILKIIVYIVTLPLRDRNDLLIVVCVLYA